jgi:hypothetical protein
MTALLAVLAGPQGYVLALDKQVRPSASSTVQLP